MSGRLLAIGDIHGCYLSLRQLVEDKLQLTIADQLVFIGDYIDRGLQSKEVLDYIIQLKDDGYSIVTLKGNHESMLMKARQEDIYLVNWLYNGGRATMESFQVRHPDTIPDPYIQFLSNLSMHYQKGSYVFVHAGFNYTLNDPYTDEYAMLWTRSEGPAHPRFQDKTIIHGHSVTTLADLEERMKRHYPIINIDTGCIYTSKTGSGYLSAIDLTNWKVFSVKNSL